MMLTDDSRDPHDIHLRQVQAAVSGVRYGSVEITIHDGRIVQIERREKFRFDQEAKEETRPSPGRARGFSPKQ